MDRSSVQKARAKLKKQQQDSEDTKKKNVEKKIKLLEKCIKSWNNNIIPNWHKMFNSVETKRLCSIGIPNHLRGEVWPLLIGNDFHVRLLHIYTFTNFYHQ